MKSKVEGFGRLTLVDAFKLSGKHKWYGSTVVGVTTSGKNGWGRCYCGRQWWGERGGCVCVMGDKLDDGGAGKVTHVEGWTKYIVLKEGVGLEEVRRMGNDERGYLYVGDNDGPKRRAQKATWSYDHGVVCGRSDRDRDDMVQEGRKGAGLKSAGRSPRSFTYEWTDTNHGKPFSATGKPVGN
ncbi:hypothetical protein Cgig2_022750 [Carnegiea gigantea]|uniref:Uncharacterized protein n=1 Tax=Carnegiea gigantea TaxID=171969 RepID=A0A9Q1QGG1_9CARY|nr:hypothetical protein Cgig2_022750 [Carnegiea gigantea]